MKKFVWIVFVVFLPMLYACAGPNKKVDESINQKMQAEAPIPTSPGLADRELEVLQTAENISPEQRETLINLHNKGVAQRQALQEERSKLQVLLYRMMVSPEYNEKEFLRTKKRIAKLENDKFKSMMSDLQESQKILGRRIVADDRLQKFRLEDSTRAPATRQQAVLTDQ